jgi:hypothetical protein
VWQAMESPVRFTPELQIYIDQNQNKADGATDAARVAEACKRSVK